jgi:hypothetical protein
MHVSTRLIPFSLLAGLLLAGCAHQPPTRTSTTSTSHPPTSPATESSGVHREHHITSQSQSSADTTLPDTTGIAACDDYLSSYMACHRAAQIFAPDQLPARYQAMRTSLLRDSRNPDIRPQLAARCNSLATQLRQALHGKACQVEPATAASSP